MGSFGDHVELVCVKLSVVMVFVSCFIDPANSSCLRWFRFHLLIIDDKQKFAYASITQVTLGSDGFLFVIFIKRESVYAGKQVMLFLACSTI